MVAERPFEYVWDKAADSQAPAVQLLLTDLARGQAPPLEESPAPWPGDRYVPVIVPDDHGAVASLLSRVPREEGGVHTAVQGHLHHVARPMAAALREALEHEPARALATTEGTGVMRAAVTTLGASGLQLRPIHRALRRSRLDVERFLAIASDYARVYPLGEPLTTQRGLDEARERLTALASGHHAVLLVLEGGQGRLLRFRQALDLEHIRAAPRNPTLRSLDLALLNALVLRTVLGVADPTPSAGGEVCAVDSLEELVERVSKGELQLGFGLNAPPRWELRAIIEARQSLPPQTLRVLW
jgi:hypothetical protein